MLYELGRGLANPNMKRRLGVNVSSPSTAPTSEAGYDVYVLIGQSEMVGRATPIDPALDTTNDRIMMLSRATNEAVLAADPLDHIGEYSNTIGPGLTFAKTLIDSVPSNRKILLVCCAQGSTGFGNDWSLGDPNYVDTLTQVPIGMGLSLDGASPSGNVLKGFIWNQGAAEGAVTKARYTQLMQYLIMTLRDTIEAADSTTPFIAGQNGEDATNGVNPAVEDIQLNIQYAGWASNEGTANMEGDTHYDAASQRLLGTRYAAALSDLSGDLGLTQPAAPTITASSGESGRSLISVTLGDLGGGVHVHTLAEYKLSTDSEWIPLNREASDDPTMYVEGLTNGSAYDMRVRVVTNGGISDYSNVATATPDAVDIELSSDFVIDLSATQTDSYAGTGDTWTDRKGNQDFWLGADGTTDGTEPTFDGTAGDPSARFLCDGAYFTAKANTALIEGMHRSDGAPFTIAMAVDFGGGDVAMMGTGVTGSSAGMEFLVRRSARNLTFRCLDAAGSSVTAKELDDNDASDIGGDLISFCFAFDPTTGDYAFKVEGQDLVTGSRDPSSTTDATPNTFKIGTNGDASASGTNMDYLHEFAIADKFLNETEMDAALLALAARRSVT